MKPRLLNPLAASSLKKCFSPNHLPAAAFCATILSFAAATSLQAVTVTWDGGPAGTATDIGTAANWVGDGLPNVITGDTAEWNGTPAGALALVYSNTAFVGAAGNLGINLSLLGTQTSAVSIDSGSNINALRMNGITLAAGAGAFSLGDGAGVFNLTMGGAAGTHTWTNNSSSTATIGSDVVMNRGGAALHTLALTGTGNWTLNNAITSADAANGWLISKAGTGSATLAGANTYQGTTTVTAGTLNYSGSVGLTGTAAGAFSIGASGGGNAILNILPGSSIKHNNTNMLVGLGITNATGQGFVNQSGGTVSGMNQLQLGAGASGSSYGYYKMSGGTLGLAELDLGGFNGASTGVMDMTAGTVNVSAWIVPARGVSGVGILNMTGGTLNFTGPAAQFQANWGAGAASVTALNVANSSLIAAPANINLMQTGTAGKLAAINLLSGGLVQANSIAPGSATGTSLVNFNGGTLKANAATTTFLTTNLTGAFVNSGGGTIDNNGVAITIPVALQTPAGSSGVTGVPITAVGSGYLGAPAVTFTGGGGTGACGYAVLTGDTVTNIVITNPGTGYTTAPTAVLTGGGGTGATTGTVTTAANTSGSMAFAGTGGTTTLSAANTYTGATTVNSGKLSVTGSLAAGSAVSVASGATLAGTGTVGGNTTVASGGNLEGGAAATGKLTLAGLTFSGAANVNIGTLSNYSATSAIGAGAITLSGGAGAAVIHIASLGTALPGTYKLLDYASLGGAGFSGFSLATLPGRGTGNLVNTGTGINLNLTGLDFLKWAGAGSAWDTATQNWTLNSNGNPTNYINSPGDSVVFDEAGAGNPTVDISTGDVAPTSVTFNNTVTDYTVQGSNGITGLTSLVKNNGAALTISNANTYSGGTTLNGGTLNINNASAIGTGPLTIAGAGCKIDNTSFTVFALTPNNAQNWNSDFTFAGTSNLDLGTGAVTLSASRIVTTDASTLTVGGIVSGTGFGITKNGDGTLVLGGVNTYTGGTNLNAGTLQLNQTTGAAALGTINVAGGTLVFSPPANNFGYAPTINLSADATISKIAASQINYTGALTGTGNVLNVNTSAGRFYMNGTVSGITQINVTGGAMGFDLNFGNRGGSAPVSVTNGASLWLANATNPVTNAITLNGGSGQGATGALFQEGGGTPTISGSVTLSSGDSSIGGNTAVATANVTISGQITGAGALTKIGINKYTFTGANNYTGSTTVNAGTLAAGVASVANVSGAFGNNSAVVFGNVAGAIMDITGFNTQVGSLTGGGATGGNVTLGAATLTTGGDNTSPAAYAGAISGTGGLIKIGTGTQIVSGASSYTGDTVINGGTLVAARTNNALNPVTSALGNPQNVHNMIVNNTGTLNFAGGDTLGGANSVPLATLVINAGGTVTNTTGFFTSFGPLTLNGGTLTTTGGAVVGYQSYSLNGDVTVGGSTASTISVTGGGNAFNGVHLGTNTTFTVADATSSPASDLDISAPLTNRNATLGGAGGLTKAGPGLLTLSGVNSYTGNTTVNGGALTLVDNAQMKFAIGANGVNNSIVGTGTVTLSGDFNLDLTAANLTSGNSWTLVSNSTLTETYGGTFTVLGFNKVGNVHTLVDGAKTWTFSEATGILTLNIAGYASWASTNAGGQASNLDFDNDGVSNGVEYFMGATGSSFTANPGIVNGKVTWPKDPNFSGTYSVQTSPDLVTWTNVASTVVGNNVEYTVPTGQGKIFVRLDVIPN